MRNIIICPQCGLEASYIMTLGHTIATCANCGQASVLSANKIIQLDINKLREYSGPKRELLMIALTSKALFENWDIIIYPTPHR